MDVNKPLKDARIIKVNFTQLVVVEAFILLTFWKLAGFVTAWIIVAGSILFSMAFKYSPVYSVWALLFDKVRFSWKSSIIAYRSTGNGGASVTNCHWLLNYALLSTNSDFLLNSFDFISRQWWLVLFLQLSPKESSGTRRNGSGKSRKPAMKL